MYAIRILKKACVPKSDIVKVYISLIRSILEYLVPAWENIPLYLEDTIESVQKRALAVIFHAGSGQIRYDKVLANSSRLNNFVSYQIPMISVFADCSCNSLSWLQYKLINENDW